MSDIATLLRSANSAEDAVRNEAEKALSYHEVASTPMLLLALAQALLNEGLDVPTRQMAGLRMKSCLYAEDFALMRERTARWEAVPPAQREEIKGTVLQTLGCGAPEVRKIAAIAVSKLAFLEMTPPPSDWAPPAGVPEAEARYKTRWEALLPSLLGMLANEAAPLGVRTSCVQTLGFVMEALDEHEESPLDMSIMEDVLKALLATVSRPEPEMQLEGMRALLHSLVFLASIFTATADSEHYAQYRALRDGIVQSCCTLAGNPGAPAPVREVSMEVLGKIAEYFYAQLDPYIGVLAPFTAQLAAGDNEILAGHALNFWSEIAREESELMATAADEDKDPAEREVAVRTNKQIVKTNTKVLVDLIGHVLVSTANFEDDEDEANDLMETAIYTLSRVAAAAGSRGEIMDHVIAFVQSNFGSAEARRRDAAIMFLASVQEAVQPYTDQGVGATGEKVSVTVDKLAPFNAQLVPLVLTLLTGDASRPRDPSVTVRESICYYLKCVSEFHIEHAVTSSAALMALVAGMQAALQQEGKVAKQAAIAIQDIMEGVGRHGEDGEPMALLFPQQPAGFAAPAGSGAAFKTIFSGQPLYALINVLITKIGTPGTPEDVAYYCTDAASEVLRTCVRGSSEDQQIALGLLASIMGSLGATLAVAGKTPAIIAQEKQVQVHFQNLIVTILEVATSCDEKAEEVRDASLRTLKNGIQEKQMDLFNLLCGCLDRGYTSAFIALEAMYYRLATQEAQQSMLQPICTRLLPVLDNLKDAEGLEYALPMVCAFARNLQTAMPAELCSRFLASSLKILGDESVDMDLKPLALDTLGALSEGPKPTFLASLPSILPLICDACRQVCDDPENEDLQEFLDKLHESAAITWSAVMQACTNTEKGNSPQEAAQAGAYFAGPGGVRDIAARLVAWASAWQSVDSGAPLSEAAKAEALLASGGATLRLPTSLPPLAVLRNTVGMMGDFVRCFGLQNIMPLLQPHVNSLMWMTQHCHSEEKADGEEAADTVANMTLRYLQAAQLP